MARTYDRMIRFYDSWFDDLNDPDKELTAEERWMVVAAIRESQRTGSTQPMRELPLEVRRALSMATLIEQLERILERVEGARARGKKGAEARAAQEPKPADALDLKELAPKLATQLGTRIEVIRAAWFAFEQKIAAEGKEHQDAADKWRHFCSWCDKKGKNLEQVGAAALQAQRDREAAEANKEILQKNELKEKAERERLMNVKTPENMDVKVWINWLRMLHAGCGPEATRTKAQQLLDSMGMTLDDYLQYLTDDVRMNSHNVVRYQMEDA